MLFKYFKIYHALHHNIHALFVHLIDVIFKQKKLNFTQPFMAFGILQ